MSFWQKIDYIRKHKSGKYWRQVYHQIALHLTNQQTMSKLWPYRKMIDNYNFEYGVCPCGQGLILVVTKQLPWDRRTDRLQTDTKILCQNCQDKYGLSVRKATRNMSAIAGDLDVKVSGSDIKNWSAIVRPIYLWKLESALKVA